MTMAAGLPFTAALDQYQQQADALFDAVTAGNREARWHFKWEHPRFRGKTITDVDPATLTRHDARLGVARQHAFETWADLVAFTAAVRDESAVARFEAAVEAVIAGDLTTLQ